MAGRSGRFAAPAAAPACAPRRRRRAGCSRRCPQPGSPRASGSRHGALRGGLSLPGGTATDGAHSAGAEPRGEAGSVQAIRVPSTLSGGNRRRLVPRLSPPCPWQSRWRPRDASLRRRRPPPATSKGLRLKGAAARETLRQADERGRRHDISGGVIERLHGQRLGRSAPNRRMPSAAMPALICTRLSKPRRLPHGRPNRMRPVRRR